MAVGEDSVGVERLKLNLFRVVLSQPDAGETVRRYERDPGLEERLRRGGGVGWRYRVFGEGKGFYVWSRPGGEVPDTTASAEAISLEAVPASVIAHCAREEVVLKLINNGFERLPGRLDAPVGLFRRRRNLASEALGIDLPESVGLFRLLRVQGYHRRGALGVDSVGVIIDVRFINRLDVGLDELETAGVNLSGTIMVWRHADGCSCTEPKPVGRAGTVVAMGQSGQVTIAGRMGRTSAPAGCLRPIANDRSLATFVSHATRSREAAVQARLEKALTEYRDLSRQWSDLEKLRVQISEFNMFEVSRARLDPAAAATVGLTAAATTPQLVRKLAAARAPLFNFQYGAPLTHATPASGLRKFGPFDSNTTRKDRINAMIIAPQAFATDAHRLRAGMTESMGSFPGFATRFQLSDFEAAVRPFAGDDADAYREAAVRVTQEHPDLVFIVIRDSDKQSAQGQNPYLAAKAVLAAAGVASQAVTAEHLRQDDNSLQWILDSMALSSYAKVGNVPFVLHDPSGGREFVVGVGRSDYWGADGALKQMFGAAVVFRQDGDFLYSDSTVPVADRDSYEEVLVELLSRVTARYEREMGARPSAAIIHVFKRTGRREAGAVERTIGAMGIPYALLHVNRDSPFWLVADRGSGRIAVPSRGSVVELDDHDRLIITGDPRKPGGVRPLRLSLDRASTYTDMDRLTNQVYGFTQTSWRGFHQNSEPSTTLFGRLLAEKVAQLIPYGFDPARAAAGLGEAPWFL